MTDGSELCSPWISCMCTSSAELRNFQTGIIRIQLDYMILPDCLTGVVHAGIECQYLITRFLQVRDILEVPVIDRIRSEFLLMCGLRLTYRRCSMHAELLISVTRISDSPNGTENALELSAPILFLKMRHERSRSSIIRPNAGRSARPLIQGTRKVRGR